ncbi:Crp/Fnr family transcriptional regulator [Saccharopolyspora hattusasensis]|uniref:Crp/Fnr family transcriptional regulator n=1 Tax=Saccharopolyspora hattusasensis TaxID=1128679 RepID=UPI003D99292F
MKPFIDSRGFDLAPHFASKPTIDFPSGSLVLDNARAGQSVMLVERGLVKVTTLNPNGAERMPFYKTQGALLGDTPLFGDTDRLPQGVRIVAVTQVRVREMEREDLLRVCRKSPEFALALLERAHRKIENLIEQLEVATFQHTTAQVAGLLHALWQEMNSGRAEHGDLLRLTHQEIATSTGRSRVSVTYAVNRLRDAGAITLHRGRIEVLAPHLLDRASSPGCE